MILYKKIKFYTYQIGEKLCKKLIVNKQYMNHTSLIFISSLSTK